ncbi:unnamed protein product [Ectocarpus sp. CCAP 1310/34]|nr:unnamed protein product [Ectocarpus sp. CCAP 1310/34]
MVGLVRLFAFTARRMALIVAATWHAYLQRKVSGIVASALRRPFARLQAELTSALPRLWGAVSNLNPRLGRVKELHRCAMNARGAMCRKARQLDETVEWLTETVLNLEAIISETRRLAIISGGAAQLNHVTTLDGGRARPRCGQALGRVRGKGCGASRRMRNKNRGSVRKNGGRDSGRLRCQATGQCRLEIATTGEPFLQNHFTYEQTQTTPAAGGRLRLDPEKPCHPTVRRVLIMSEVCRHLHDDGLKHERRGRENCKLSKNGQGALFTNTSTLCMCARDEIAVYLSNGSATSAASEGEGTTHLQQQQQHKVLPAPAGTTSADSRAEARSAAAHVDAPLAPNWSKRHVGAAPKRLGKR